MNNKKISREDLFMVRMHIPAVIPHCYSPFKTMFLWFISNIRLYCDGKFIENANVMKANIRFSGDIGGLWQTYAETTRLEPAKPIALQGRILPSGTLSRWRNLEWHSCFQDRSHQVQGDQISGAGARRGTVCPGYNS